MDHIKCISVQDAEMIIKSGKATIVDVRNPNDYHLNHIPHAHSVSDGNIEDFLKKTDKNNALVCYCYHGISSQSAASYFLTKGFKEVYSVNGGFEEWKKMYA
jgi:thiosulfate sulfurtransferase